MGDSMTLTATFGAIILVTGALASSVASATTTITFSGLTGANGTPLVGAYAEGGFTVTPVVGQFLQDQQFGNPLPSLAAASSINNLLDITEVGGGLFDFESVDLAATGNVSYTFSGFQGNLLKFLVTGAVPNSVFETIASATPAIDDLRIALSGITMGTSGNVDNIVLNPVPSPGALPLLATGLGALGLFCWRRKQKRASALAI
jgi:hypothetical protein